jgi:hypothetical protein
MLRVRIAPRLLKPFMFIRRVINDEIDYNSNATLTGGVGELNEVAKRAIGRVDSIII